MTQEILDKIAEIKELAGLDIYDPNNVKIIVICEKIEIDYQIEKRLENANVGNFVTAILLGKEDVRQGVLIENNIILTEGQDRFQIEPNPTVVPDGNLWGSAKEFVLDTRLRLDLSREKICAERYVHDIDLLKLLLR